MAKSSDSLLDNKVASFNEAAKHFFAGLHNAFPASIKIHPDGSISIDSSATVQEISQSFKAAVQLSAATVSEGNTLNFVIGELVNAAVAAGIFENKKSCAIDISNRLASAQPSVALDVKTIENYARVAERIPPELRKPEVVPTIYHIIANVKQPRQKQGESIASYHIRTTIRNETVFSILKKVHSGEITTVTQAKQAIDKIQKKSGLKNNDAMTVGDYAKIILDMALIELAIDQEGIQLMSADKNEEIQSITVTPDLLSKAKKW